MSAKVTKVRLTSVGGLTEAFEIAHAENILRLPNCQWRIAEGEKFEWKDNAIRGKKNSGRAKVSEQGK